MKEVMLFMRTDKGVVPIEVKVLEDFKNGSLKIQLNSRPATAYAGTWLKKEHVPKIVSIESG